MVFKEVKGSSVDFWKPEEIGETLEGFVISVHEDEMFGTQLDLQDQDGVTWRTPSHRVLQNRLRDGNIAVGNKIKIVYQGIVKAASGGKNATKGYALFVDM